MRHVHGATLRSSGAQDIRPATERCPWHAWAWHSGFAPQAGVRSPSPCSGKELTRRGEDAVPASAGEASDREPEPWGGQGTRREDAERAPHEVREPERADGGARTLQALHLPRHRRARRPEPVDHDGGGRAVGGAAGRVHRRPGDGADRRLHRKRPGFPHAHPALHRGCEREHRRDAAAALLRPARGGLRARADRDLHAQPEGQELPGRPADHGRPRAGGDARLQLRLLRRVEKGRPADVEQARLRPWWAAAARGLQDHPDSAR